VTRIWMQKINMPQLVRSVSLNVDDSFSDELLFAQRLRRRDTIRPGEIRVTILSSWRLVLALSSSSHGDFRLALEEVESSC